MPLEGEITFHYEGYRGFVTLSVSLVIKIKKLLEEKDADSNAS